MWSRPKSVLTSRQETSKAVLVGDRTSQYDIAKSFLRVEAVGGVCVRESESESV